MPWQEELLQGQTDRRQANMWRTRRELASAQAVRVRRENIEYLNFSSNDYLGLAADPRLARAAAQASQTWGVGSGASHMISGHQSPHHLLEQELAEFCGAEDAVLFSTGYMANLAIPQTFLGRSDLILQDKLNHASLLDAANTCRAEFKRFRHLDYEHAGQLLSASTARRKMLTVDSVFSMDGDVADLLALSDVCRDNDTLLVVDEAHAIGVLGDRGAGALEAFGLSTRGNILAMGTLGKAFGSFGAYVAGDKIYIDELKQRARTYIYTTALPAIIVEATRAALRAIQAEPDRREKLHRLIAYFRERGERAGLQLMDSTTAIQPILIGDEGAALRVSADLEAKHIWVPAIRPPTVPKGTARLRVCLSSMHSTSDIDQLLDALSDALSEGTSSAETTHG